MALTNADVIQDAIKTDTIAQLTPEQLGLYKEGVRRGVLQPSPTQQEAIDRIPVPTPKFDSMGTGYDYETAAKYGIKPSPIDGHWQSRVPETGQILKGVKHPTFHKTVEAERKMGHNIMYDETGKLYSMDRAGLRDDGTEKGIGFLGRQKMTDGSGRVVTDMTVRGGFRVDGISQKYPLLVSTLNKAEVEILMRGGKIPDSIRNKAIEHAKDRMEKGLSPFSAHDETAQKFAPFYAYAELSNDKPKTGGYLSALLRGLGEGISTEFPAMVGRALQFSMIPGVRTVGKAVVDWADDMSDEMWGTRPEYEGFARWLYLAGTMIPTSMIPIGLSMTGAKILMKMGRLKKALDISTKALAKGKVLAAAKMPTTALVPLGHAQRLTWLTARHGRDLKNFNKASKAVNWITGTSVGTLFGMSQAQTTKDTMWERIHMLEAQGDIDGANALRSKLWWAPLATGAIEGIGETLGARYLSKLFRMRADWITEETAGKFVQNFLLKLGKTAGMEISTEVGQAGGQAAVEKYAGVRPEARIFSEMVSVIGPTAVMTLLLGGASGAINLPGNIQRVKLNRVKGGVDLMNEIDTLDADFADINNISKEIHETLGGIRTTTDQATIIGAETYINSMREGHASLLDKGEKGLKLEGKERDDALGSLKAGLKNINDLVKSMGKELDGISDEQRKEIQEKRSDIMNLISQYHLEESGRLQEEIRKYTGDSQGNTGSTDDTKDDISQGGTGKEYVNVDEEKKEQATHTDNREEIHKMDESNLRYMAQNDKKGVVKGVYNSQWQPKGDGIDLSGPSMGEGGLEIQDGDTLSMIRKKVEASKYTSMYAPYEVYDRIKKLGLNIETVTEGDVDKIINEFTPNNANNNLTRNVTDGRLHVKLGTEEPEFTIRGLRDEIAAYGGKGPLVNAIANAINNSLREDGKRLQLSDALKALEKYNMIDNWQDWVSQADKFISPKLKAVGTVAKREVGTAQGMKVTIEFSNEIGVKSKLSDLKTTVERLKNNKELTEEDFGGWSEDFRARVNNRLSMKVGSWGITTANGKKMVAHLKLLHDWMDANGLNDKHPLDEMNINDLLSLFNNFVKVSREDGKADNTIRGIFTTFKQLFLTVITEILTVHKAVTDTLNDFKIKRHSDAIDIELFQKMSDRVALELDPDVENSVRYKFDIAEAAYKKVEALPDKGNGAVKKKAYTAYRREYGLLVEAHMERLVYSMSLETGIRPYALRQLEWQNINFNNGDLNINDSKFKAQSTLFNIISEETRKQMREYHGVLKSYIKEFDAAANTELKIQAGGEFSGVPYLVFVGLIDAAGDGKPAGRLRVGMPESKKEKIKRSPPVVRNSVKELNHDSLSSGWLLKKIRARTEQQYKLLYPRRTKESEKDFNERVHEYVITKSANTFRHLFAITELEKGERTEAQIAKILGHGGGAIVATYSEQIRSRGLKTKEKAVRDKIAAHLKTIKVDIIKSKIFEREESSLISRFTIITDEKNNVLGLTDSKLTNQWVLVKKGDKYFLYDREEMAWNIHSETSIHTDLIPLTDIHIREYALQDVISMLNGDPITITDDAATPDEANLFTEDELNLSDEKRDLIAEARSKYNSMIDLLEVMIGIEKGFAKKRPEGKAVSPEQTELTTFINVLSTEVDLGIIDEGLAELHKRMTAAEAIDDVGLNYERDTLIGLKNYLSNKLEQEVKDIDLYNIATEADLPKNAFTRKTFLKAEKRIIKLAKKYGVGIHHITFVDGKIPLEVNDKRKREILKAQGWSEEKINEAIKNKEPIYITGKYEVMAGGQVFITLGHGANLETFLEELAHAFIQQGGEVKGITDNLILGLESSEEFAAKALARAWAGDLRRGKIPAITKKAAGIAVERYDMIKILYSVETDADNAGNFEETKGLGDKVDLTPEEAIKIIKTIYQTGVKEGKKWRKEWREITPEEEIINLANASDGKIGNELAEELDGFEDRYNRLVEEMRDRARQNTTLASRLPTRLKKFKIIQQVLEFFQTLQTLSDYQYIMAARLEMGGHMSTAQRMILIQLRQVKEFNKKYGDSKNQNYQNFETLLWQFMDNKPVAGGLFDSKEVRRLRNKIDAEVEWLRKVEYLYAARDKLTKIVDDSKDRKEKANVKLKKLQAIPEDKKTDQQRKQVTKLNKQVASESEIIEKYEAHVSKAIEAIQLWSNNTSGVGVGDIRGKKITGEGDELKQIQREWDKKMDVIKEAVKQSDYNTLKNISDDVIPKDIKVFALKLKRMQSKLSDMLLKREIISRDTYWNYHGRYVHYQYMKNMVRAAKGLEHLEAGDRGEGTGSLPGLTEQREHATEQHRQAQLKIERISMAISGGMAETLDYIAKADFYSTLKNIGKDTVLDFKDEPRIKRVGNRWVVTQTVVNDQHRLWMKRNIYLTGKNNEIAKLFIIEGTKETEVGWELAQLAKEISRMERAIEVATKEKSEGKGWTPDDLTQARLYLASLKEAFEPVENHMRKVEGNQKTLEGEKIDRKLDFVKDYRLVTGKVYGKLDGEYLATPLYDDITPITTGMEYQGKTWGTVLTATGASIVLFKIGKATLNIPTGFRNVISNVLQNNLRGRPLLLCMKDNMKSFQALVTKNPKTGLYGHEMIEVLREDGTTEVVDLWDEFVKDGGIRGTLPSEEIMGQLAEYKYYYEGKNWYKFMTFLGGLSKYYGMIDVMAKYAIYRQLRTTGSLTWLGRESGKYVSPKFAMMESQKWGMDYSLASVSIKNARKFAIPFITYQYKVTPLIAESILRRPWVMAKYGALMGLGAGGWSLAREAAQFFMGMDDDEWERVVKSLAHYIKDEKTFMPLPIKDARGKVMFIDGSFFMPWGTWWGAMSDLSDAEYAAVWKKLGVSNPFFTVYTALSSAAKGKPAVDPFTHKPIWNMADSPGEKWLKIGSYMHNVVTPGMFENIFVPGADKHGAVPLSAKVLWGKVTGNELEDKWGRIKGSEQLFRFLGVNTVTGNRRQVIAIKNARIKAIKAEAEKKMHHPRYKNNPVKRRAIMKRMREKVREIRVE